MARLNNRQIPGLFLASPVIRFLGFQRHSASPSRRSTRSSSWKLTQRRSASKTEPNAGAVAIIAVARKRVIPGCSVRVIVAVAVVVVSVDVTRTAGAPAASKLITGHTNLFDIRSFRCSSCCGVQRRRRSSGGQERGGSHNGKDCLHTKLPSGCLVQVGEFRSERPSRPRLWGLAGHVFSQKPALVLEARTAPTLVTVRPDYPPVR